jgi:hypothetical protein
MDLPDSFRSAASVSVAAAVRAIVSMPEPPLTVETVRAETLEKRNSDPAVALPVSRSAAPMVSDVASRVTARVNPEALMVSEPIPAAIVEIPADCALDPSTALEELVRERASMEAPLS